MKKPMQTFAGIVMIVVFVSLTAFSYSPKVQLNSAAITVELSQDNYDRMIQDCQDVKRVYRDIPTSCTPFEQEENGAIYKITPPCYTITCICEDSGRTWNCTEPPKKELISITSQAAVPLLEELQQKQIDDPENRDVYDYEIDQILQVIKD